MKYSYDWLKELSGTKLTPEKVVENLTMHSFEIEGMEKMERKFPGVVVGKILEINKHPNADKLQIVLVETRHASSVQKLSIVCGAWNIKVGDKMPVALVGTKLANGMIIKEVEIRGHKSFGMLCAEDELGLGKDHSGIIILDKNAKTGEPVDKYLGINDTVIEIKVLPDRAHDALSHVSVAREMAVLAGKKLQFDFDNLKLPKIKNVRTGRDLSVQIRDDKLCPRYIGAVMGGVEIKESPKWLKDRLIACGMNAINNVVDATNYVMLEIGQPLHAFDSEKIKTNKIVVRSAKNNEELNLLDKGNIKLTSSDLLITDGEKAIALAGIKGGLDSGISDNTETIILEAASFDATNIRKTRTRLGIRTESSDRFEKDIDPNLAEKAMARLIAILVHIADGKLEQIVDVYPKPVKPWKIKLNLDYVNKLLGEIIYKKEIVKILTLLDVEVKSASKNSKVKENIIECDIPTFRLDLRTQEDLIEEIGRIYGYEKIKPAPMVEPVEPPVINEQIFFETAAKEILTGLGFSEVYNYSFYSERDANICGLNGIKHLELANPQNPDQQLVRVSLIPNLIKNVRENLKNYTNFKIFEEGRIYLPKNNKFPEEKRMLMMAEVSEKDSNIFYKVKGSVEAILNKINIIDMTFQPAKSIETIWHPTRTAQIKIDNEIIGIIGEINPLVLAQYKIKKRVAIAEFDLEILRKYSSKEKTYQPLRKFPIVTRDISLLDRSGLPVAEIAKFIQKTGSNLVLSVELFDTFQKDGVTSHAFHINFGANRTLERKEVEDVIQKVISGLKKELQVGIRK